MSMTAAKEVDLYNSSTPDRPLDINTIADIAFRLGSNFTEERRTNSGLWYVYNDMWTLRIKGVTDPDARGVQRLDMGAAVRFIPVGGFTESTQRMPQGLQPLLLNDLTRIWHHDGNRDQNRVVFEREAHGEVFQLSIRATDRLAIMAGPSPAPRRS